MTVQAYYSTDAAAPVLTGQVGSLVNLLNACLVTGYGAKAGAGWTMPYTATNKAVFQQGAGSNGYFVDVNDAAPSVANEARMRGYEAMTAPGVGTMAFPTMAQQNTFGTVCRKSATTDATARAWYLIADSTVFYLFTETGDATNPVYAMTFMFGDFFSYKPSDTYGTAIIGRSAESNGSFNYVDWLNSVVNPSNGPLTTSLPGHYLDRHWSGVGGSVQFGKFSSVLCTGSGGGNGYSNVGDVQSLLAYPNGPDGALDLSPIWVSHNGNVRGYLKGLWAPCQRQPVNHGATFNGTGNMAGKSFLALFTGSGVGNYFGMNGGELVIETSNTWS